MKFPTLYHKGKTGKIIEWKVWTKGPEVHVEWGEIDGKKQTTHTVATAKNVGKKNEIDPKQQAEIEAAAMHKHRLDRKYSLTIKEAEETIFLPMLAHEFEKKKHKLKYPVDVQPKIDGNRAMAYWEGKKIVLMSRGGKIWQNLKHIEDALAKVLPKGMVVDGEIWKPGLNLQNINKLVKKFREGPDGTESLVFMMFDCLEMGEDKPWSERSVDLYNTFKDTEKPLYLTFTETAENEKEVLDYCTEWVEEGWEGAIVRNKDGKYALGERSSDLLKVKNFQDDEFEIVGHYVGEGKHEGTIGWWCKTKTGKEFKCYPRGTMEERRIKNPEQFYGEYLKIRFQFLTDEGIPFLPIGLAIRLKEDM